jgi:iron complex outermembrane receptor protein
MPGDPLIPPGVTGDATFKETVPHLNLSYDWSPELMTYLSYSEGYKGGGFVQRIFPDFPVVPSFDPEFVEVYEAGFKYFGASERLRLNGAAFHTDYTDLQVVVFESGIPITRNAAGAEIDGFELEAEAALTGGLRLNLGIGYLDAEYTEIDPGAITDNLSVDSKLVNAPKWSVNAGAAYAVNLPGLGTLTPRIDWSHNSRTYVDARNTPELIQDAYGLLNLSLTFEDESQKWLVQLFGTNVTDERYLMGGVGGPDFQGVITGAYGRPAEWGLTVKRRF